MGFNFKSFGKASTHTDDRSDSKKKNPYADHDDDFSNYDFHNWGDGRGGHHNNDHHGNGSDHHGSQSRGGDHHGGHGHGGNNGHGHGHGHGGNSGGTTVEVSLLGTFNSGLGEGAAEIVAHDPQSQRLFVTNAEAETVDILDISDPKHPTKVGSIDVGVINGVETGGPNSVAVAKGIIAVAVEAANLTDPGLVAFYDADGNFLGSVGVGALPDMLVFTPDGKKLLVANEGESDGVVDPKGSVGIIDLSAGVGAATVKTADFTAFDSKQASLEAKGVRIFDGKVLSDDVEPEYIAIAPDGKTAFITLQEANAVAVLDIQQGKIVEIQPLGAKNHSKNGNGLDASDRDGGINIDTAPVFGLYMPDGIAAYEANGKTYYVTANEGDDRGENVRIKDIVLDPTKFPNAAELQADENIGRLAVSSIDGDTDGDGDYDRLFAYGARSFTIWDEDGKKVFDSGDMLEQIIAELTPELFNADDSDPGEFDTRSDAKGPEPESVVVGEVNGRTYAFVGLERAGGGVMVFDISNPKHVEFSQYIRTEGDIAPEGLDFISAKDSPIGVPLLAVANEVSGTTSIYQINFEGKTIKGSNKNDKLEGTAGDDTIDGRGGNDKIHGFAGNDDLIGGDGNDKIYGGYGDDGVDGGKGNDKLYGDHGDDFINGGKGDDQLFGGDGDDRMTGGAGNDEHDGGTGRDIVVFSGNRADYLIDTDNQIVVDLRSGFPDGVDRYENVEFLEFADETFGLPVFTLELLHFTDQEASTAAIQDAPNLSAVLAALRAQDIGNDGLPDNTVTLSSGDMFIPGVFFGASQAVFGSGGIADIQIQNELGVQAAALGNHEFDFGTAVLAGLISGSAPGNILGADFDGTDFPYLSSNLDFSTNANLGPLEVAGGGAPQAKTVTSSVVIDVNGEPIGVVGATTPTLPVISSPGTLAVSPSPFDINPTPEQLDALAAIIQAEVDALLDANPALNKVILLAHMQQLHIELALAERLENVDIIVAGGSNTRLFDDNDRIRDGDSDQGQYPQFVTNAGGTTTAVVNTDGSYKYVGRLVLDFDADGNIIADSYDQNVSGAYATDDQGVADLGAEGLVDPEIQQIVDAIEERILETESNVFGVSNVFLNGNRTGTADADNPDGVRSQETNLGNLTADANLAAAQAVDSSVLVSIKNGGGIRASIGQTVVPPGGTEAERLPNEEIVDGEGNVIKPEGGISQNDIATALAFNNGLTLLTLTKAELVAVLEHGVSAVGGGSFAQVSGVKYSYDPDLPAGSRIQNAGIFDSDGNLVAELVRDGAIVGDPGETFRIVTLNFMADGGDGYPFPAGPGAGRLDLYDLNDDGVADQNLTGDATFAFDGTEQDALAEYLQDNHPDQANAYDEADTGRDQDSRIQNLDFRDDGVFDGIVFPPDLVLNEIRIDQTGADNDEYFELYGDANLSLDGFTYLVIGDGSAAAGSGAIEAVVDLSGLSLDTNGYFVAAEGTFTLGTADLIASLNFENSDNVTHMLVRDFTGTDGADLDANDDGVLDVTPWSEVIDSVALVTPSVPGSSEHVYSATQVGPDGSFVPGHVYRSPDGGDWQIGLFDPAATGASDSPGAANPAPAAPVDAAIFEIQGAGHRSPHEGAVVRTTGVVTAVAFNGFYVQDPTGDGNIATSEGIFVLGSTAGVAVGHAVEVEGTVEELQFGSELSVTRIVASDVAVTSTGNALPDAVVLGVDRIQPNSVIDDDGLISFDPATDAIDFLESLEGMRVEVNNPLVIAGTNRFDEVGLAANRGGESGPGILNAVIAEGDFNPEILLTDDALVTEPNATTGDTFAANPVGVLDYTFGAYKLQLTETPVVIAGGRSADTTALVGDASHLTVATYNAFNLDPSDGDPGGAFDRLDALAQSIVNNLQAPDIIALEEIQDNSGETDDGVVDASQTLQELVDAIATAGGPTYAFAQISPTNNDDGGAPGANIRAAFLYNPLRVDLDESSLQRIEDAAFEQGGDGTLAEAGYAGTRKPLVGEFTFLPTGETVTVIGNHLKSKSEDDALFGESQPPVENTLAQRVDQAGVINQFVANILTSDVDANVIVLGDMNDFQFSDTLDAMKNANGGGAELTNLVDILPAEDQYSFIFNGNSQLLDHILVSDNLFGSGAEVDVVHANLDFGTPFNVPSDHDPIVARFDMDLLI